LEFGELSKPLLASPGREEFTFMPLMHLLFFSSLPHLYQPPAPHDINLFPLATPVL
jgi:hypothetical protein